MAHRTNELTGMRAGGGSPSESAGTPREQRIAEPEAFVLDEIEGPDPDEQIPCDRHSPLPNIKRLPDF